VTDLVTARQQALASTRLADVIEADGITLPQGEAPVIHHFGPGIYIREVHLPARSLVVGHHHKASHLNIMLTGVICLVDDAGGLLFLRAPHIFTSPPGRKTAYVLEDCIWQNVIATEERDIDALEALMFDKSAVWQANDAVRAQIEHLQRESDRVDFAAFCAASGFSPDMVRAMSVDDRDQMPMPDGVAPKFTVRPSSIEGRGVFVSAPVEAGETIAPARLGGLRTPAGRYTNHSAAPNARFTLSPNGDIYLVALRRIAGCVGGSQGEEVTVDYRQALSLSGIHVR